MKIEKTNKNHKVAIILGLFLIISLILTVLLTTSRAKYRATESIPLAKGTITVSNDYDFNIISMYIKDINGNITGKDGTSYNELSSKETMPSYSEGYYINTTNSYCYLNSIDNIDTEASLYTNDAGELVIKGLQKGDKCILYFDKIEEASTISDDIIDTLEDSSNETEENYNIP